MSNTLVVAGATGNLGTRIVKALRRQGAETVALVRPGSSDDKLKSLQDAGAEVASVDTSNVEKVSEVFGGAACIVSALQGLHDVIVDAQTVLLNAAVKAGVPRFIPSDFSTDFTASPAGENRNFDLRREFHVTLEKAAIAATSIFNGAFAEILTFNSPLLDMKKKTIGYWGDPDWHIDFTTMDDTAAYTASAALDPDTPKALRIASFQVSARDLQNFTKDMLGKPYELIRLGTVEELAAKNKSDRATHPEGERDLYASWQQGQYMQSMFTTHHKKLDNNRYANLQWARLEEFIELPS